MQFMGNPHDRINIDGPKLVVLPFGNCLGGVFDLTQYQGTTVRLYLDEDGTLSLDQSYAHWWQLAEVALPAREYVEQDIEAVNDQGPSVIERVPKPLDLNRHKVIVWPLPEVLP